MQENETTAASGALMSTSEMPSQTVPPAPQMPPMTEESDASSAEPYEPAFETSPLMPDELLADNEDDDDSPAAVFGCILAIVIALILAGTGVWYFFFRDADGMADTPDDEPVIEEPEVKDNLINARNGGTIRLDDGAKIIIPPGALTEDAEIFMERVESGRVTDKYKLRPEGLQFKKPVTVVVPYHEEGLYEFETADDIVLYYQLTAFAPKLARWTTLSDRTVSTTVTQF